MSRRGKGSSTGCGAPRADRHLPTIYNRFTFVSLPPRIYRQEEPEMRKLMSKLMLGAMLLGVGLASAATKDN